MQHYTTGDRIRYQPGSDDAGQAGVITRIDRFGNDPDNPASLRYIVATSGGDEVWCAPTDLSPSPNPAVRVGQVWIGPGGERRTVIDVTDRHAFTGRAEQDNKVHTFADPSWTLAPLGWVSRWRKTVDYHRIGTLWEATTGCGRSTRTGIAAELAELVRELGSNPCRRCFPDGEARFVSGWTHEPPGH